MRTSQADLLFIPGLGGSGPDHWQSRWAQKLTTGKPVDVPDVHNPLERTWRAAIIKAIAACERPVVLIAHSLGAIAVVHAAGTLQTSPAASGAAEAGPEPGKVRAAFLVAPPASRILATIDQIDPAFAAVPSAPLPFPSLLVASRNDPYASMQESEGMALDWGSQIVDAGEAGHLDADSGHGPWPEGLMRFAAFMAKL